MHLKLKILRLDHHHHKMVVTPEIHTELEPVYTVRAQNIQHDYDPWINFNGQSYKLCSIDLYDMMIAHIVMSNAKTLSVEGTSSALEEIRTYMFNCVNNMADIRHVTPLIRSIYNNCVTVALLIVYRRILRYRKPAPVETLKTINDMSTDIMKVGIQLICQSSEAELSRLFVQSVNIVTLIDEHIPIPDMINVHYNQFIIPNVIDTLRQSLRNQATFVDMSSYPGRLVTARDAFIKLISNRSASNRARWMEAIGNGN